MDLFNLSAKSKQQIEEIQIACAERFSSIPPIKAKIDELQAKIHELEEKIAQMEGGLKAFLNMQSMIGQENVNILELLIAKIGSMEKSVIEKLVTIENSEKKVIETKNIAPPPAPPKEMPIADSAIAYSMQTMVNRSKFLHVQRYLTDEKATGKGKLLSEIPLTIQYHNGEICSIYVANHESYKQSVVEFSNALQELRGQELERESSEDLVTRLAEMIQHKNQYLSGLALVLGKLSKKQLIERIRLNTPPLLEEKEDGLFGEVVFHFTIKNWPKIGNQLLLFQFSEEHVILKKEQITINIPGLLSRCQRYCSEHKEIAI